MRKKENAKRNSKFRQFLNQLYPTYVYDNVESIPYFVFDKYNIKLIMIDMDNTLIDYHLTYQDKIKKWIKGLKKKGIKLYILSNSKSSEIVKEVAHKLGMQYYLGAKKPFLKGFNHILEKEKIEKQYTMMIGDQIFTDVWGGNRFGIKTILVKPIGKKEAVITKIKRPFEKLLLKNYHKHRKEQ